MNLDFWQNYFQIFMKQANFIIVGVILLVTFLIYLFTKYVLVKIIYNIFRQTRATWDDKLADRRVFDNLGGILPLLFIYFSAYLFPTVQIIIQRICLSLIILLSLLAFKTFLKAINDMYLENKRLRNRPIKGYLEIISIFFFIIGFIVIISIIIGKSPWIFISSLGAMTAILLLIFKDTILSFIASLQITFNDLIKIGDWIEVSKYEANGTVVEIALHTLKVQNWDKTITIIPTYKLIDGSFKNWRGMQMAGGRRIKRAINIDISTIEICSVKVLSAFAEIEILKTYIHDKLAEMKKSISYVTNLTIFRNYVKLYLKNHPAINQDLTFLIRELEPSDTGLPLEIYVFTKTTVWAEYEEIKAELFEHLFAMVHKFDLKIFQNPSGNDFKGILNNSKFKNE